MKNYAGHADCTDRALRQSHESVLKGQSQTEEIGMTIFDGVRRGAIFVAGVLTIISAVVIWTESTGFTFLYQISNLGKSQGLSEFCDYYVDGSQVLLRETDDGRSYMVVLCFRARKITDGRMLVEYRDESGVIRMSTADSEEVKKYTRQVALDFHQTPAEMLAAKDGLDERWRSHLGNAAVIILVGLLFFWLFMESISLMIKSMPNLRPIDQSHDE